MLVTHNRKETSNWQWTIAKILSSQLNKKVSNYVKFYYKNPILARHCLENRCEQFSRIHFIIIYLKFSCNPSLLITLKPNPNFLLQGLTKTLTQAYSETSQTSQTSILQDGIYLLTVKNRNTRRRYEICSKLTIKTPERRH